MKIRVTIPFEELYSIYLPEVIERGISPEITLKADALDTFERKIFREVANLLKKEALCPTIHLPFMDLSLSALDPWIRKVSLKRLFQGMEIASLFEPELCVFHSGYHPDYHREPKEEWRKIFIEESLPLIIDKAREFSLSLALENVFEPYPEFMRPIYESFKGELFWCFDPAHARVFSEREELYWLEVLYPYLSEIHCHDNLGKWDEHLPVGRGIIKFKEIFQFLKEKDLKPSLTIEAKKREDALLSFQALKNFLVD
ncbi:MAG: sugar phosphate isomerase/epimerase family protein [Caldimicrobium sp.]